MLIGLSIIALKLYIYSARHNEKSLTFYSFENIYSIVRKFMASKNNVCSSSLHRALQRELRTEFFLHDFQPMESFPQTRPRIHTHTHTSCVAFYPLLRLFYRRRRRHHPDFFKWSCLGHWKKYEGNLIPEPAV